MNLRLTFKIVLVIGLAMILGLFYLGSGNNESSLITDAFKEHRNQVASILKELSELPDVDLGTLTIFEARNDFKGAADIMENVITHNKEIIEKIKKLKEATRSLLLDGQEITDAELRNDILDALLELDNGNKAMEKQFNVREAIFQALATYYSDRAAKKKTKFPTIDTDFQLVDQYTNEAKLAYENFNEKIQNFDRLAGLR